MGPHRRRGPSCRGCGKHDHNELLLTAVGISPGGLDEGRASPLPQPRRMPAQSTPQVSSCYKPTASRLPHRVDLCLFRRFLTTAALGSVADQVLREGVYANVSGPTLSHASLPAPDAGGDAFPGRHLAGLWVRISARGSCGRPRIARAPRDPRRRRSAVTTRVVKKTPKKTTDFAKKTTFDDLTFAKSLISLARNKWPQNVVICHHLSSILSRTH